MFAVHQLTHVKSNKYLVVEPLTLTIAYLPSEWIPHSCKENIDLKDYTI